MPPKDFTFQEAVTRFAFVVANRFMVFAAQQPGWPNISSRLDSALKALSTGTTQTGTCTYSVDGKTFQATLTKAECDSLGGSFAGS